jgi:hypothetical protein
VTNGGFAAVASSLRAVAGPGDEVIFTAMDLLPELR